MDTIAGRSNVYLVSWKMGKKSARHYLGTVFGVTDVNSAAGAVVGAAAVVVVGGAV